MVIININFINDNINVNAINGKWTPLMDTINGSNKWTQIMLSFVVPGHMSGIVLSVFRG
jgi:hypothetical protein